MAVTAPNTVRVTTNSTTNLYTSYDGGINWSAPVNLGAASDLNDVAVYGKYVWTVQDRGLFSTADDGGYNFTTINLPNIGGHAYGTSWGIGISALDEKRIWVGCVADLGVLGGLIWTNDGGRTWHEPSPSLYGYDIWRISFVGGVK